jgi:CsoR family transcriptional regulator, copper-sensing transcriptional repressor
MPLTVALDDDGLARQVGTDLATYDERDDEGCRECRDEARDSQRGAILQHVAPPFKVARPLRRVAVEHGQVKYPPGVCYALAMDSSDTNCSGHGYTAGSSDLVKRLNRIEGQVRGVRGMVVDDRYCIDVLTQISAVQAALDKVALGLMEAHVEHCVTNAHGEDRRAKAAELTAVVRRLMRSR